MTTTVRLSGPLDIPTSLEMFRHSGDDLIDRWDGTRVVRTVPTPNGTVAFAATLAGRLSEPALEVVAEREEDAVAEAVRGMFVPTPPQFAELVRSDTVIGSLDARFPGLRPVRYLDLLTGLIRSISAQQVNLPWAATTRRRLAEAFGRRHEVAGHVVYSLEPERLAGLRVEDIRALQFTTRKAEYIIGAAAAVAEGRLDLAQLGGLPDEEVIAHLTALHGIGRWTSEWILARMLGRPVVVAGDLGVRKAVGAAYLDTPLPDEASVRAATAHWGQAAGVAQALLLQGMRQGAT